MWDDPITWGDYFELKVFGGLVALAVLGALYGLLRLGVAAYEKYQDGKRSKKYGFRV